MLITDDSSNSFGSRQNEIHFLDRTKLHSIAYSMPTIAIAKSLLSISYCRQPATIAL